MIPWYTRYSNSFLLRFVSLYRMARRWLLLTLLANSNVAFGEATAPVYNSSCVDFFSHIPGSSGTAWSFHLLATFLDEEIAPGSRFRSSYGHGPGVRSNRTVSMNELDALIADTTRSRVVFAHNLPNFGTEIGLKRCWHTTTMLSSAAEKSLHNPSVATWTRAMLARLTCEGSPAAARALEIFAPHTPLSAAACNSWRLRAAQPHDFFSGESLLFQLRWLATPPSLPPPFASRGGGVGDATACLASTSTRPCGFATPTEPLSVLSTAARAALRTMPWFGLSSHWLGSTCLWHFVTKRPWPATSDSVCPRAQREALSRVSGVGGKGHYGSQAPSAANGRVVCPPEKADAMIAARSPPRRLLRFLGGDRALAAAARDGDGGGDLAHVRKVNSGVVLQNNHRIMVLLHYLYGRR